MQGTQSRYNNHAKGRNSLCYSEKIIIVFIYKTRTILLFVKLRFHLIMFEDEKKNMTLSIIVKPLPIGKVLFYY